MTLKLSDIAPLLLVVETIGPRACVFVGKSQAPITQLGPEQELKIVSMIRNTDCVEYFPNALCLRENVEHNPLTIVENAENV